MYLCANSTRHATRQISVPGRVFCSKLMSSTKTNNINPVTIVLTLLGIVVLFTLLSKLFKDIRKNTSNDIISEEGQEILGDPKKREELRKAVEHYHKEGNWNLLTNLAD
jgi:hypothetical protein